MKPEIELSKVWTSFLHEVRDATSMLMYALAGIEVYQHDSPSAPGSVNYPVSVMSGICLSSMLSGVDYHNFLGSAGLAVQLAYKGWIEHIYGLWENTYRNKSQGVLKVLTDDAIRPETDVLGDLRQIRNDFVHGGAATANRSGNCSVLKWFSTGEQIVINFNHVLDLLNQIGALQPRTSLVSLNGAETRAHTWNLFSDEKTLRAWSPEPILVSVRTSEGPTAGTLGVSVVFDNGVFGQIPLTFAMQSFSHNINVAKINKVAISADGKRLIIGEGTLSVAAHQLYANCLIGYFRPEQGVQGPGMGSPRFRFRRDNS